MHRWNLSRTGIAIVILLSIGLYVLFPYGFSQSDRFDQTLWQHGSIRERGRMASDLAATGRLLGLGCDEVIALLGAPDHRNGDYSFDYSVDIGYRYGSHPWLYQVHISFGNDGKVKTVELRD